MPENKPLTFEQFVEMIPVVPTMKDDPGMPRWDGFYLYFQLESMAPHLRQTQHFLKLQAEYPDLETRLTHNITNRDRYIGVYETLKPYGGDMHVAYVLMYSYGASDEDLLIAPK